jgi:transposase
VFLDETGLYLGMTRRYGRAPAGAVVREATPTAHWETFTLLGGITLEGMLACMTVDAPTDTDIFLTFLKRVLCPKLKAGNVVVLDNLSVHHVAQVRETIEATGAKLLYLPPYSPDLNPIEPCWSKIKQKLRGLKAQVVEALDQATSEAVAAILPENVKGFFGHSGYRIQ